LKILFNKILLEFAKLLDPERAHFISLLYLKFNFLNKLFFKKKFKSLNTTFCNINLENPIGVAAGLDKNAEAIRGLFNLGVSLIEVGAVTPKIQYGNRKPRVFRLNSDFAIINRLGFNNLGMKKVRSNLKKNIGYGALGLNVGANKDSENKISDFIEVISYFSNEVDYFTINISSPNTHGLRNLQKEKNLEELLSRITINNELKKIKKPILIKISPDLTDENLKKIVNLCKIYRIAGIVATNTTINREYDLKSSCAENNGGLSGKPLFNQSNIILAKLYFLSKGTIPLIGVGGIFSGEDAYKKICIGASIVQLYTAFAFKGPLVFSEILEDLNTLVKKDGYKNISEAVGSKNYQFLVDETDRSIFG
tara:strand:- start:86 stop:1183 length:1098 start_codon:yes stop_codon:yes gene_type:complete